MRPETVGRCGCVDGNKCKLICGERTSEGSGDSKSVGSRSCIVLTVLPSCNVLSSGGWWSFPLSRDSWSVARGAVLLNQTSRSIVSTLLTCAKHLQFRGHAARLHCGHGRIDNRLMDVLMLASFSGRRRRDDRGVRITPASVICDPVFSQPFVGFLNAMRLKGSIWPD